MTLHFNEKLNVIIEPGDIKPQKELVLIQMKFKSSFKGSKKIFQIKGKEKDEIKEEKNVT